jgi:hypothetical protein
MDGPDFSSRFRDFKCPGCLVLEKSDFPMTAMPTRSGSLTPVLGKRMAQIYVGVFSWDFPDPLTTGMSISRCAKTPMALDLRHVSLLTDGPNLVGILRLSMSRFTRPRELRFPDGRYPDACRDSSPPVHGVHSHVTPTDPTAAAAPPELTHFLPNLGRISIFRVFGTRDFGFFGTQEFIMQ